MSDHCLRFSKCKRKRTRCGYYSLRTPGPLCQEQQVEKECPGKIVECIDMQAYGTMNGAKVIAQVKKDTWRLIESSRGNWENADSIIKSGELCFW